MSGTVFAVALNHQSQMAAWGQAFENPPYKAPPKTPVWFIKPRNTLTESGKTISYPPAEQVFSGGTLALVVGKIARKVAVDDAYQYIAGYRLANELSLAESSFYRPAIKARCRDGFCPLAEMAVAEDVSSLEIITEVNGKQVDSWNTRDLQRGPAQLLSALSEFATLQAGDCILLGTPQQRVALRPDDEVTVRASGFPSLTNRLLLAAKQPGDTA